MKRLTKNLIGLILIISVLGCRATPYQKLGTTSAGGYSDKKISEDTFYVRFVANDNTSPKVVCSYLYRRAAELTRENGFRFFTVIRGPDQLTERLEIYSDKEHYEGIKPPFEADVPDASRLIMTIKCFQDIPEICDMHLINAQEYLANYVSSKVE